MRYCARERVLARAASPCAGSRAMSCAISRAKSRDAARDLARDLARDIAREISARVAPRPAARLAGGPRVTHLPAATHSVCQTFLPSRNEIGDAPARAHRLL